jgi:hypothetical protein
MKRGQKVEVVKVGDASSDTEFPKFPSRTPYGKLIGKRGVIRCENAGHIGSWVVRFEDFSEHALPEEYLVAIEEDQPPSASSWLSALYRERDELRHRLTGALDALDAIYRAHTPGKGCAPGCACTLEEDEDCDCGVQEAADDVADYAHGVHAALVRETPQEPPALGWTWTDTPLVSVADNGVCIVQEESGLWAIEYRCLLLVACIPTRTAGRRCAEKMGMEAIQKQCEESLRVLMGNDGSKPDSTGEA